MTTKPDLNPNIFRQYDIRGHAEQDLHPEAVRAITLAFARFAGEQGRNKFIVGHDNRISSERIHQAVIGQLLAAGQDVIDIGEVITPVFYFAARHLEVDAGFMITASHNPGEDNGFKLLLGPATIYGDDIQRVLAMAQEYNVANSMSADCQSTAASPGILQTMDIEGDYLQMMKEKIQLGPRPLKIVIDCGNGTASSIAPRLFRELGCEVIELYCESDPSFPNHHPDPVKVANCQDLIQVVKQHQADAGIGFDGDGDRLGVVDPAGDIIWGDTLMILFWREILPQYPGSECIVEVKCSQSLVDEINRLGGRPEFFKTGHSLIKARMKEIGAIFTGEMSGHMFFADEYYGYDDALYAAARLLRILSHSDQNLHGLLENAPRYSSTPEMRVKSTDEAKFAIVDQVREHFRQDYEIITVDGARILFPGGWGLVRASNTGPELIVRCEGIDDAALDRIKAELYGFLNTLGLAIE